MTQKPDESIRFSRRKVVAVGAALLATTVTRQARAYGPPVRIFDVARYGAVGDGKTLDSPAIQRAINEAAAYAGNAQVLVGGGKKYLVGTLELKGPIDFHLADDAQLLASLRPEDYLGGLTGSGSGDTMATAAGAVIMANNVQGLKITGTGSLQGRAREFMVRYDETGEWWIPKEWRPKMFVLTGCRHLEIRDITFAEAPNWGLHMLGCDGVLVDNVKVRNLMDVPNCDGIDPDHSRNVEIRNCDVVCGDDAVVIKTSRQATDYGPCANISVRDCVIETRGSGLKIGSETVADVQNVVFERCKIKTSGRGLAIQLRDEGSVSNIAFKDISFESRHFATPWWGHGEAISFTAFPRKPETKLGAMHHIRVQNVTGRAENSVRIWGSAGSRVHDVLLDHVDLTLDRWTRYPGGTYDNRPTTALPPVEPHEASGFSIQTADDIALIDCKLRWGTNRPRPFGDPIESKDVDRLRVERLDNETSPAAQNKKGL